MDAGTMDRQLVTRVEPEYPSQAKSQRIQGDLSLEVRAAADGTVESLGLVRSSPQPAGAAIAAVKQWKYRPVISAGRALSVLSNVNVPFRLRSTDR
jgi:protein TonB